MNIHFDMGITKSVVVQIDIYKTNEDNVLKLHTLICGHIDFID
jgi:hypothetical protein